jgi:malate synthase
MQVWQCVRHHATAADGTVITADLVRQMMQEEAAKLTEGADERVQGLVDAAQDIFEATCLVTDWPQFFTNYAYDTYLVG